MLLKTYIILKLLCHLFFNTIIRFSSLVSAKSVQFLPAYNEEILNLPQTYCIKFALNWRKDTYVSSANRMQQRVVEDFD